MAAAAARLLRRSFSLLPPYKSVASSYSSLTASLRLSRSFPSASGAVQLPTAQLLHSPPFQSLAFCSAASVEDSDGDGVAAPELSKLCEEHEAPLRASTSFPEPMAGTEAPYRLAREPRTAMESGSERFQQIPMKKGDWICPHCSFMNFARNFRCLECKTLRIRADGGGYNQVAVKRGDWTCPRCGLMNFFKNIRCLQCKADMPASGFSNVVLKKGDWHCPECKFMNFAKNLSCLQCNTARPLNEGDWHCPKCQFLNFSRNSVCRRCQEMRPENPSSNDWECPSCKYLNSARNIACLKCKLERPMEKSGLGLPMEARGTSNGASHPDQDSLLFDDNLFGSSNNDATSLEDEPNQLASEDEISSR